MAKGCLLASILAEIPDTIEIPNLYLKYSCKLLFYLWIIWEGSEPVSFKKKNNSPTCQGLGKG